VLVARALVQDAGLVLLDEPFTGVDAASAEVLAALIDRLAAEGRGVLVATHDVDQARGFDRVLCLNGRQVAFGAPDVLTRAVLEETYGGAIVAVPEGDGLSARGILPAHHHEHGHSHE
jgi:ABC-type Mn2+/Zn2+ transport system ATPase subunit